jgi:transglutaminase-like putative cysteine protease
LRPIGEANNLIIPASDNQKVKKLADGSIIVTVAPVSNIKGGSTTSTELSTGPLTINGAQDIIDAIKPNRFLQSDDVRIIELSKKAVGDAKNPAEAAKRIEQFVADYIEYRSLSVGYASATEVAVSRKGDCSEFAVLCAALCRAAGIPARVVVGVAYVDDFMGKSGFGGHAWVEAYIEGKWVGLDSAFKAGKRGGYDAGHIALAMGDGEPINFFNLATTLGRFKIEKVTVNAGK